MLRATYNTGNPNLSQIEQKQDYFLTTNNSYDKPFIKDSIKGFSSPKLKDTTRISSFMGNIPKNNIPGMKRIAYKKINSVDYKEKTFSIHEPKFGFNQNLEYNLTQTNFYKKHSSFYSTFNGSKSENKLELHKRSHPNIKTQSYVTPNTFCKETSQLQDGSLKYFDVNLTLDKEAHISQRKHILNSHKQFGGLFAKKTIIEKNKSVIPDKFKVSEIPGITKPKAFKPTKISSKSIRNPKEIKLFNDSRNLKEEKLLTYRSTNE